MTPKGKILNKVPAGKYNKIPFLDRPLRSILRFMRENRAMNEQSKTFSNIEQACAPSVNIEQASAPSVNIEQACASSVEDIENGMYYTIKNKHPYDPQSIKQMEIFGFTFSNQSNVYALHKISPIYISKPNIVLPENYQYVEEPQTYNIPIAPTSFLRNTIPQVPNPAFVNFLQACSK